MNDETPDPSVPIGKPGGLQVYPVAIPVGRTPAQVTWWAGSILAYDPEHAAMLCETTGFRLLPEEGQAPS